MPDYVTRQEVMDWLWTHDIAPEMCRKVTIPPPGVFLEVELIVLDEEGQKVRDGDDIATVSVTMPMKRLPGERSSAAS